jgi:hypothetical protein
MRGFWFIGLILLIGSLIVSPVAEAQQYNHIITVYASVPEQRAIYLDEAGSIIKIAGNTTKNLAPQVFDSSNKPAAITDAVQKQYDDFLKQHNYHLEAGKIYNINPISVDLSPNTQVIELNDTDLSLGNLKIN